MIMMLMILFSFEAKFLRKNFYGLIYKYHDEVMKWVIPGVLFHFNGNGNGLLRD